MQLHQQLSYFYYTSDSSYTSLSIRRISISIYTQVIRNDIPSIQVKFRLRGQRSGQAYQYISWYIFIRRRLDLITQVLALLGRNTHITRLAISYQALYVSIHMPHMLLYSYQCLLSILITPQQYLIPLSLNSIISGARLYLIRGLAPSGSNILKMIV